LQQVGLDTGQLQQCPDSSLNVGMAGFQLLRKANGQANIADNGYGTGFNGLLNVKLQLKTSQQRNQNAKKDP